MQNFLSGLHSHLKSIAGAIFLEQAEHFIVL